ncbi:MAG: DNA-processing protein DprA [Parabacteroides sp.]|nr:DNA-processing protein DprA [Parabacteroides sp.]
MSDKRIYQIGLTMINGVGDIIARQLLQAVGDAEAVFAEKAQWLERIQGVGHKIAEEIKNPQVLIQAEKELSFIEKSKIKCCFLTDEDYPYRLRECEDAPILFYFKGEANLNANHIISIVGTRNATDYGYSLSELLIKELSQNFPDMLIISGLAYGIDISAHRNALKYGLPTVAVLAHGLDRIYPPSHRSTAVDMLDHGGLLTDFPSGTDPDKQNFIRRNRIVAGLSDATIVIESAEKGGSLITADIAFSYGRDVYCFPGRIDDNHSKGCNNLIKTNKAGLITSAADVISAMRWNSDMKTSGKTSVQTEMFFPENTQLSQIVLLIEKNGEIEINELSLLAKVPIHQLSPLLFELEMNGIIKTLPGNVYKII